MIKKFLATMLLCAALVFGGCTAGPIGDVQRTQSVDSDIEQFENGVIIISGTVDEDTYKEFYRYTSTGKKHYTVHIMTNGGCGYNTIAIMNHIEILQAQGVKFTMVIPGHGFSAGAFIFMMGDERIMYRGSHLMWHTITVQYTSANRAIPAKIVQLITEMDSYVVGKFIERFPHIDETTVMNMFYYEDLTWMSEYTALSMGIATKIIN